MAISNILSVQHVKKSFGNLHALDDVSMDIRRKSVTILIGPNGSGKTTLINVISGLYRPDSGRILFNQIGASRDVNVTGYPPYRLYKMGLGRTFQVPALFWKLTVLENLLVAEKENPGESFIQSFIPSFWRRSEEQATKKALRILQLLGLSHLWNQPSYNLSGGQMKLVEMGRALMSDAQILLLDEPVSGVNPTLAHEIFSRILKLRDELGLSFFIVEHRLDIALKYVDEMFAMALGKVIASGEPDQVMKNRRVIDSYLGG